LRHSFSVGKHFLRIEPAVIGGGAVGSLILEGGKCNLVVREPERACMGAKMASQCMLRLTLPRAQVTWIELRPSSGMLTLSSG
jgi:hypothetical protein